MSFGFRLAAGSNLDHVHIIDSPGAFEVDKRAAATFPRPCVQLERVQILNVEAADRTDALVPLPCVVGINPVERREQRGGLLASIHFNCHNHPPDPRGCCSARQ